MDTLNRDLGQLAIADTKRSFGSFLDVVGADVDSSFERPMQFALSQDTYHISTGQQQLNENSEIQIQVDEDNAIHYLHKYAVCADLYVSSADEATVLGIVENYAMLFNGTEMNIGDVTWATAQQKYYSQFKLATLGKKELEYIAHGLGMKHEGFAQIPHSDAALWVGSANNANALVEAHQLYARQLFYNATFHQENDSAGHFRVKIVVPLPSIFPALWEIPDDGAIFTGFGKLLKLNIKTTQANECVMSNGDGAPAFHMKNVSLFRCYTKLDKIRSDLVLKSKVEMPYLKYKNWNQGVLTTTVNAVYGVDKSDRVRGLIFAFPYNSLATSAGDGTNVAANLLNTTAASFKTKLGYFPQMPIQLITIDVGGQEQTLNMSQLQVLHVSNFFGDQKQSYSDPLQRQLKHVYYFDLTRFGFNEDSYGSSADGITSVKVTIQLITGTNTLLNQPVTWTDALLANFQFVSFLETQRMFEWRNGSYQIVK